MNHKAHTKHSHIIGEHAVQAAHGRLTGKLFFLQFFWQDLYNILKIMEKQVMNLFYFYILREIGGNFV